jgi:hypothetical protein
LDILAATPDISRTFPLWSDAGHLALWKHEKEAGRSDQAIKRILEGLEGKNIEMKGKQKKVYPASISYEEGLNKGLKIPAYAIGYLNAILEENDPDLLLFGPSRRREGLRLYSYR